MLAFALLAGPFCASEAPSLQTIELREGLAIRGVARSGRSPVVVDGVLDLIAREGWKPPSQGQTVRSPNGEERTWELLGAEADGAFDGRAFAGGYASFSVERPESGVWILEATGWGMAYVNGAPRAGDPYGNGSLQLPVLLRKGTNHLLFAAGRGRPRARLTLPPAEAYLNPNDWTLPDAVSGSRESLWGAAPVVNATERWLSGLRLRARVGADWVETLVPAIPPLTFRKVPFRFEPPPTGAPGSAELSLVLADASRMLDFRKSAIRIREPVQSRKVTFLSGQDGSLQYYAVQPAPGNEMGKALVLSLHGAGVEAIGQADAYQPKDWCHIVAPTNRRPFGFDWEETGRRDALEVLSHARASLQTDPSRTYLTGHSMGGHGAWTVGLHYPDLWAAIAPCAGWISFFTYAGGVRHENPVLRRAGQASDTLLLLTNALHFPIYILHGEKDDNVPVAQAREMKGHLERIGHPDATSHEEPGAGHWFGNASVDWPGIFEMFRRARLALPAEKVEVDFTSVKLSASSQAWWVQIVQQIEPMEPSRVRFKRSANRIVGTTENVGALRLFREAFPREVDPAVIELDGQTVSIRHGGLIPDSILLQRSRGRWLAVADRLEGQKRPEQMGPFKEVFQNGFSFVYGTSGRAEETLANLNKARYDAEVFAYRGNGSVRIVSDRNFLRELEEEAGRVYVRKPAVPNVVLYGHSDSNAAWNRLLADSPIQVGRGWAKVGEKTMRGEDLACLFVRPRSGDDRALVAAVAATGRAGQVLLDRVPVFVSGVHLPDWAVFSAEMLSQSESGIRAAGFFANDWGVRARDMSGQAIRP
jgi:poly(3-hydroxybutyrate) depolymerase